MIKLGRTYIHKKSGKELLTQHFAKSKINGEWVNSIIYTEGKADYYVRSIDDFSYRCELVE